MVVARRVQVTFLIVLFTGLLVAGCWAGAPRAEAEITFESLSFVDAQHGWVSGVDMPDDFEQWREILWRTSDGGQTWAQVSSTPRGTFYSTDVAFTSPTTGLWWNIQGLFRTTTAGRTWKQTRGALPDIGALCFVDASVGWAAGGGRHGGFGTVCRTSDGGRTWHRVLYRYTGKQDGSGFLAPSSPSRQHVYVLGQAAFRGLWVTSDAGTHWKRRTLPSIPGSYSAFYDIDFALPGHGWAVGSRGTIMRTTDGGRTWTKQASGTAKSLTSVSFTSARAGFVTGGDGLILHTSDGGAHWSRQTSGTGNLLTDADFVDAAHGWIIDCGSSEYPATDSTVLRTTDGGETWR